MSTNQDHSNPNVSAPTSTWYPGASFPFSLAGRVMVLTGVTGGIGHAIVRGALHLGARVVMIGRSKEKLEAILAEFAGIGAQFDVAGAAPRLRYICTPLEQEEEVRKAAQNVIDTEGVVDVLVNSAGTFADGDWREIPVGDMKDLYQVNVVAPFVLCQVLANALIASRGQVVFMNSSSVQSIGFQKTPYTTTKFAMKGLADSFRQEFNRHGIRTLSVFPGRTATDMQRRLHEGRGEPFLPHTLSQPEDIAGLVLHILQTPRTSEVTEIFIRPMSNWDAGK